MKQQHSAGIIVYKKEDDTILYLLLRYSAGHWDFPKGKIESGETKEEAALRELKEETNLRAQIDDNFEETIGYIFWYDKQLTQKTVYFFTGQATSNDIQLSDEHTDFAWLPYKEALERLTYDNAKGLLKKINNQNLLTN